VGFSKISNEQLTLALEPEAASIHCRRQPVTIATQEDGNKAIAGMQKGDKYVVFDRVLDTTLCDKVCQLLVAGWWFSPVSSTNKTEWHDITEILLKVALDTINQTKSNQTKSTYFKIQLPYDQDHDGPLLFFTKDVRLCFD
jgi:hypothetical protein